MIADIVDSDKVDYEEVVRLQRRAFAGAYGSGELDRVQTVELYRWKYTTPVGPAKIATLRDRGALVAMTAGFPEELLDDGAPLKGWQFADIATDPTARRRGCFRRCIRNLRESISGYDAAFVFPNPRSAKGFRKFGWDKIAGPPFFIGFIPTGRSSITLDRIESFDKGDDYYLALLSSGIQTSGIVEIRRSTAYLNWRYLAHPVNQYEVFVHREGDRIVGLIVLRMARLFSLGSGIIMELCATTSYRERQLLRFAVDWTRRKLGLLTIMVNTVQRRMDMLSAGFVEVPSFMLPRPFVLMADSVNPAGQMFQQRRWSIQTGDWDGF
jgi:hypothetical protein